MKNKIQKDIFPEHLIKSWDASDGVNFAIALARITGWLLQVDWFTKDNGNETVEEMKSLRVYVGDDHHNIFDVKGKMKITSFAQNIIKPLLKTRAKGEGGVLTRFYSEEKLMELPLRVKPDLKRISEAEEEIKRNRGFLDKIPPRSNPWMPAHKAANFSFRACSLYATALHEITGLPVSAIIGRKLTPQFTYSDPGYLHSLILLPDGSGEDAWGKNSLDHIVSRYGVEKYRLDEAEHWRVVETLKKNSPDRFEAEYNEAKEILKNYVPG